MGGRPKPSTSKKLVCPLGDCSDSSTESDCSQCSECFACESSNKRGRTSKSKSSKVKASKTKPKVGAKRKVNYRYTKRDDSSSCDCSDCCDYSSDDSFVCPEPSKRASTSGRGGCPKC